MVWLLDRTAIAAIVATGGITYRLITDADPIATASTPLVWIVTALTVWWWRLAMENR